MWFFLLLILWWCMGWWWLIFFYTYGPVTHCTPHTNIIVQQYNLHTYLYSVSIGQGHLVVMPCTLILHKGNISMQILMFIKYSSFRLQVLLMTLQNAPPGLDYDRDRRFSKVILILSANYWFWTIYVVTNYDRVYSTVYLLMKHFHLCLGI